MSEQFVGYTDFLDSEGNLYGTSEIPMYQKLNDMAFVGEIILIREVFLGPKKYLIMLQNGDSVFKDTLAEVIEFSKTTEGLWL